MHSCGGVKMAGRSWFASFSRILSVGESHWNGGPELFISSVSGEMGRFEQGEPWGIGPFRQGACLRTAWSLRKQCVDHREEVGDWSWNRADWILFHRWPSQGCHAPTPPDYPSSPLEKCSWPLRSRVSGFILNQPYDGIWGVFPLRPHPQAVLQVLRSTTDSWCANSTTQCQVMLRKAVLVALCCSSSRTKISVNAQPLVLLWQSLKFWSPFCLRQGFPTKKPTGTSSSE